MVTQPGNLRSTDPLYLKWAYEWMGQIDTILARHQLTNGTGSVIAYQIENEIFDPSTPGQQYMQDLQDKARADGINVNDLGPQSAFPIPAGILNPHGSNTIAIAVWGEEGSAGGIGSSGGLGKVTLIQYGNFRGGLPVSIVAAPPIGNAGD
jgi:Glycosyl hydrolases family 35/Beta-galactosidase jelly roll domain